MSNSKLFFLVLVLCMMFSSLMAATSHLRRLASDCNDPNVIRINLKPIKQFFTEPNDWQIALIIMSGLSVIAIAVFLIRNCRVTCDRRSYQRETRSLDKRSVATDLESVEVGLKSEDEKYLPKSSFRKDQSASPSRSPSMKSIGSQRSLIVTEESKMTKVVNDLLAEGVPVVGVFVPEPGTGKSSRAPSSKGSSRSPSPTRNNHLSEARTSITTEPPLMKN